jgi:chromosome segregation ATPase
MWCKKSMRNKISLAISVALVCLVSLCFIPYNYAEDMAAYPVSHIAGIQAILKGSGLYKGSIDGINGSQTKQAVKEFQKIKGLKPDGIVGRKTREKLSKYLSERNSKILKLSEQVSKLQKENYFYQNQLNAVHEESIEKDRQLQELTRNLEREREEYEVELAQNKKDIKELQSDYEDRLRIESSKVAGLVKERGDLIAEGSRLKNLQFVRLHKLKSIKRELDAVIEPSL